MKKHAAQQDDPRVRVGRFGRLMSDIRACKARRTCPKLTSRQYYFEPNPDTIGEWQEKGFYKGPLNSRVVFVCESPGPQNAAENITKTRRCWDSTGQDARFEKVRCENGFQDCYITNSVKCGVRRGSRHTDAEIGRCSVFLVRELELLKPMVVVAMGGNAFKTLREHVLPEMKDPPVLFGITHYSARGDLWPKWEMEFGELQRLLKRLKPW